MNNIKEILEAIKPLYDIANQWHLNGLDESRPEWGDDKNIASTVDLVSGRGGKQLLTIGDCLKAKDLYERLSRTSKET